MPVKSLPRLSRAGMAIKEGYEQPFIDISYSQFGSHTTQCYTSCIE
jgi:hypothetical protein